MNSGSIGIVYAVGSLSHLVRQNTTSIHVADVLESCPLSSPNRGRGSRISEEERKTLTFSDVGNQYRTKAGDASSSSVSNAGINDSCGTFFQQVRSECLRSNIAGWRQAISVLLGPSNVMEFSAEICPIINVVSNFLFVPVRFLQPELLVVGNFCLGSLQLKARIPSAPIRGVESGAIWCGVAEGGVNDSV
jgi:hypothetical protein